MFDPSIHSVIAEGNGATKVSPDPVEEGGYRHTVTVS